MYRHAYKKAGRLATDLHIISSYYKFSMSSYEQIADISGAIYSINDYMPTPGAINQWVVRNPVITLGA